MGDDLLDLPVLARVGLSAAPADAAPEVRAARCTGSARPRGGRGAVRELIELVLRAQGRWDGVVAEHSARQPDGRLDRVLLAALVALLAGLAIGKAWERYKLRDGRWIDRRRARESPHYMLGLNFLVANQIDLAIEELTQGRRARRRSARDPPDPRQPVSREGPGRPGDPGAPGAAAAARTCASSSTPTCCSASASTTSAAASSIARSRRSPRCCGSIPRTSTRCRTSRSCTKSSTSGPRRTTTRQQLARAATTRAQPGTAQAILAFLENELGLEALQAEGLRRGGAPVRSGDRARRAQRAGAI